MTYKIINRAPYILPLIFLLLLLVYFFVSLRHYHTKPLSSLLNQPAPFFSLGRLDPLGQKLTLQDLRGRLSLINFFSSSCHYCLKEHAGLMELAKSNTLDLYGIHVRNKPEVVKAWLERYGNPYKAVGMDTDVEMAVDWGVVSTPETFILDPKGIIIFHHRGPLSASLVMEKIIPLIEKYAK